jgi:tetratricopeptide (TPR) repeat protein
VTEDIRTLTTHLAEEPASLAFLDLGETLRRRGQLDAAYKVARGGVIRYPGLADAHDLAARILCDQGDLAGAFDAWALALRVDPMRASALKGIGFLYFRAGDRAAALEHLLRASAADPDDPSIHLAIARARELPGAAPMASSPPADTDGGTEDDGSSVVPPNPEPVSLAADEVRAAPAPGPELGREAEAGESPGSAAEPFARLDGGGRGVLLVDACGMRLAGGLDGPAGDVADEVAALLAGVSKEASRTARLLGLGAWLGIAAESADGNLQLVPATSDTLLLAVREPSVPPARVALLAERAVREARAWLGEGR